MKHKSSQVHINFNEPDLISEYLFFNVIVNSLLINWFITEFFYFRFFIPTAGRVTTVVKQEIEKLKDPWLPGLTSTGYCQWLPGLSSTGCYQWCGSASVFGIRIRIERYKITEKMKRKAEFNQQKSLFCSKEIIFFKSEPKKVRSEWLENSKFFLLLKIKRCFENFVI